MDESGDGQLGADELKFGFEQILGKSMTDEKLNEIVEQVDGKEGKIVDKTGNRYIDYSDFLIASIDYSENQFYQYCEKAYELYFNNSLESIDVQELVDIFCQEKLLSHDLIEFYIKKIDADGNGNIEVDEFFTDILENLQVKKLNGRKVTLEDIENYIKDTEKYPDYGQGKLVNPRMGEI